MQCRWLEGKNIAPKTAKDAKALVGKQVTYLRGCDIDRSGRGFYFPRSAMIMAASGKNIEIDNGDWLAIGAIVEMVERAYPPSPCGEEG